MTKLNGVSTLILEFSKRLFTRDIPLLSPFYNSLILYYAIILFASSWFADCYENLEFSNLKLLRL